MVSDVCAHRKFSSKILVIFTCFLTLFFFTFYARAEQLEIEICEENWECTEWGICDSGVAWRECVDLNNCGTEINKPPENRSCSTTATGIVTLTILEIPEICGDNLCVKNETCASCPKDCGVCSPSQTLAGFMTSQNSNPYTLIFLLAFSLLFLHFTLKGKMDKKFAKNRQSGLDRN